MDGAARVVLVEFIAVDRFHRAIAFPFVHGYLRGRGLFSRWLRFGLPAAWRAQHAEDGANGLGLDVEGEQSLSMALEGEPTHVLLSAEPTEALARALRTAAPAAALGVLGDAPRPSLGPTPWKIVAAETSSIARFFGLAPAESEPSNLFERVTPDFGWEAGNAEAEQAPALPFLVCGEECGYRRPLSPDDYRGVDLSGCTRLDGCSFCLRSADGGAWSTPAMTLASRQLEALGKTHPRRGGRLAVRAVGSPFVREADAFADLVRQTDLPPIDFLLDTRADTLVAQRPRLDRAAALLRGTGHRLHIALVGLESFSNVDLERLNKGTTWRDNLLAAKTLFELEREHPQEFRFREHGGLSLLLYSPWTRIEDLALNLAIIDRARLFEVCGKVFTSRVRLYPALPLYALAARDGLLGDGYEDPWLDTARRNFYSDEAPWRFRDPRLEAVSRISIRLAESRPAPDDPLREALEETMASLPYGEQRLRFAATLVDVAIAHEEPLQPVALLGEATRWVATPPGTTSEGGADGSPTTAKDAARGRRTRALARPAVRPELTALLLGHKPVVRLEGDASRQSVEAALASVRDAPHVHVRERRGARCLEIFVGQDPSAVEETARLSAVLETTPDEDVWRAAALRAGELLGYPACCVQAFVKLPARMRERYTWLHLARRIAAPGEVSRLLNPACQALVTHVPCSLECPETLRRTGELLEALRRRKLDLVGSDLLERLAHPWLVLLDDDTEAVELRTETDPRGRFRFQAGQRRGRRPLTHRAAEGDEMIVDDHQLVVLRRGRLWAALGGRAFLWWYRAPVQADFWKLMSDLRFDPRRIEAKPQDSAGAADVEVGGAIDAELRDACDRVVAGRTFCGFSVLALAHPHQDRIALTLARGTERLRILVTRQRSAPQAYLFEGPVAVMLPAQEQIATVDRDRAVRQLARELAAHLGS